VLRGIESTGPESNFMRHFIQYHNPDVMGRPYQASHKNFGIVTNKFFASLVGGTVWLVTGKGRPRRYFLCSSFIVDKVERDNAGCFRNRPIGSAGRDLNVEIGELPWFPELLKMTGNFGLGLLPISSKTIIQGLQKVL
jgi:hypothetical protein